MIHLWLLKPDWYGSSCFDSSANSKQQISLDKPQRAKVLQLGDEWQDFRLLRFAF